MSESLSETVVSTPSHKARRLFPAPVLGFVGVALGAFGAHAIKDLLVAHHAVETWHTAVQYHLFHVLALLFVAVEEAVPCWIGANFMLGIFLFSGSLYLYAVTGLRWLMFLTPLGGLAFLAGWLGLAVYAWRLGKGKA